MAEERDETVIIEAEPGTTVDIVETDPLVEDPELRKRRPRKVYAGMWGVTEIAAVAASGFVLLTVILVYFFAVAPTKNELEKNRSEAARLEAERILAQSKYGDITSTTDQVTKLLISADDFETRFLPPQSNGQSALYQRLNGLIAAYGLTNTSGPDYAPLETAEQGNNQSEQERGRERFRSLFPGVYVTMTVEGSYQNLRRFIREIETGNEFVIVSSVELASSENEQKRKEATQAQAAAPGQPGYGTNPGMMVDPTGGNPGMQQPQIGQQQQVQRPQGKTHGEVVALRLEMAAYFRRPNFAPMAPIQ
jgi:hypothetical protein